MKLSHIIKALVVSGTIAFTAHSAKAQEQYLGEIKLVGFNFAPLGFAQCNGQILSIAQNSALFSLLGTTYGGDGRSNFALPDLQGRVAIGMGNGAGLSPRVLGETGGQESVTLTIAQLPAHSHPILAASTEAAVSSPSNAVMAGKARVPLYNAIGSADTAMAPTGSAGGNQPFNNMQPFLALNYVIALEGIYPPRS
jgi:microcystin-dependent protein